MRQPQHDPTAERLWVKARIIKGGQSSITELRHAPVDARQDGEVQTAQKLILELSRGAQ